MITAGRHEGAVVDDVARAERLLAADRERALGDRRPPSLPTCVRQVAARSLV
jgi:hypothetical protein